MASRPRSRDNGNHVPSLPHLSSHGSGENLRDSRPDPDAPNSPLTSSSVGVMNGSEARAEDIISPGPVRSVQVQRFSVLGGKPKYFIADVDHNSSNKPKDGDSLLDSIGALSQKHAFVSNAWIWTFLVISTIVILGAFAFLCYFWVSHGATRTSIITSNWAVKATTLAATIVWLAVEIQAMIAGLLLLCYDARDTPRSSRNKYYSQIRKERRNTFPRFPIVLGLLILLLCSALHFISTILLSDFDNGILEGTATLTEVHPYSLVEVQNSNLSRSEMDYSGASPANFPAFAEYTQPAKSGQVGIDDTGEVVRAVLPLDSATNRSALASYDGMATLMNSRVICLAPTIENITYTSTGPSASPASPAQRIAGTLNLGSTTPDGLQLPSDGSAALAVNCGLQLAQVETEYPFSLCRAEMVNSTISIKYPEEKVLGIDTSPYLLLDHTNNSTIPLSASAGSNNISAVTISSWDTTISGMWTNLTYAPNPIFSMRLSLCFIATGSVDAQIKARGGDGRTEPTLHTSADGAIHDTDVTGILTQLGVFRNSIADRDLMSLSDPSTWVVSSNNTSPLDASKIFGDSNMTYGLCTYCGSYSQQGSAQGVAGVLSIMFQQAMKATGSPARAVQAIFTTARLMQYYSRLPYFDQQSSMKIRSFEQAQAYRPIRYNGLIATGALLTAHLSVVALITILAWRHSQMPIVDQLRQSLIGSSSTPAHSRNNSVEGAGGVG